jgi:enolase
MAPHSEHPKNPGFFDTNFFIFYILVLIMQIKELKARKILNSRKEETIEVSITTAKGKVLSASPSGKSRGKYEAEPFSVKGIDISVSFANFIGNILINSKVSFNEFNDLEKLEELLRKYDNTKNWSMIGGNTVFALESAILKAMALSEKKELWQFLNEKPKFLPMPLGNCIGGGEHVKQPLKADFQEFLILPEARHFFDAYYLNLQSYREAKRMLFQNDLKWKGQITDESALASTLDAEKILALLRNISIKIKSRFNINLKLGIDAAASTLLKDDKYSYKNPEIKRSKEEQLDYISSLIKNYDVYYIEDAFNQEDFDSFSKLLKENKKSLICGDDLICTQPERLQMAINSNSINSVIIKPNQNGSLLETKKVVDLAKKNSITPVISHRSGETMDSTISDLAVGWQIPIIKTGILGKERFAKLHRLLRIERELGKR